MFKQFLRILTYTCNRIHLEAVFLLSIQVNVYGYEEQSCQPSDEADLANDRTFSTDSETKVQYAYGIAELAQAVGCCQSTIYALKKSGVLDSAVVSRIGKRIIFDVGKARTVADNYQKEQRASRRPDEQ